MSDFIDIDGHTVARSQIAGLTKTMVTQYTPENGCEVFFDMLTRGQATLRFARMVRGAGGVIEAPQVAVDRINSVIDELNEVRAEFRRLLDGETTH